MSFQIATVLWFLPAACALAVAAVGARIGLQIYRQEEAIQQLERLDACFRTRVAGPTWLRRLMGEERMTVFEKVWFVALDDGDVSDDNLVHLKGLTNLEHLYLNYTQLTDTGLAQLRGLKHLKFLGLAGTRVTDRGWNLHDEPAYRRLRDPCTVHCQPRTLHSCKEVRSRQESCNAIS